MHFDHGKESGLSATVIFKPTMMMIPLSTQELPHLKSSTTSTQALPQVQHNFQLKLYLKSSSTLTQDLPQIQHNKQLKLYLKSSTTSTQALPQVQRKQSSATAKSSAHCYHQHQAQIKTKVSNLSEYLVRFQIQWLFDRTFEVRAPKENEVKFNFCRN